MALVTMRPWAALLIDQIDSAAVPEAAGWAGQWPVGVGR